MPQQSIVTPMLILIVHWKSGTQTRLMVAINPEPWQTSKMSTKRQTLLERHAKATKVMKDLDAPEHLRTLARRSRETAAVVLGLQDAEKRKQEKPQAEE